MTDLAYSLIVAYGVPVLFAVTYLSCLALPVPSSLMMLAAGSFAAAGDLPLVAVVAAAYCGAVLGDNSGYFLAKMGSRPVSAWLDRHPKRAALRLSAENYMTHWGGPSVFFSCWLVAPLGPYVNYASGMSGFRWIRFFAWGALGELFWVGIYVGAGYTFANQITALASLLGDISGFLVATVLTFVLGRWLWQVSHPAAKPRK